MIQARRPAGTPAGGQFAQTHRQEAVGVELVDDAAPAAVPDGHGVRWQEGLVVVDKDRGDGRIMAVVEDPNGSGRDVWRVRFSNGEERTGFADDLELAVEEDGAPVSRPRTEKEFTTARRAHSLRSLAEREIFDAGCSFDDVLDDPRRFLFIEHSTVSGGACWSTFDAPGDAASYSTDQECPEYWSPAYLVDLDTGERFSPAIAIRWQPDQPNDKEQQR